jgi:hypothetical protein
MSRQDLEKHFIELQKITIKLWTDNTIKINEYDRIWSSRIDFETDQKDAVDMIQAILEDECKDAAALEGYKKIAKKLQDRNTDYAEVVESLDVEEKDNVRKDGQLMTFSFEQQLDREKIRTLKSTIGELTQELETYKQGNDKPQQEQEEDVGVKGIVDSVSITKE